MAKSVLKVAPTMREYIHFEDAARASVVALGDDLNNQHVVLTGKTPMRVMVLSKMLAEISGVSQGVMFTPLETRGHYVRTPYAYQLQLGRKYESPIHVNLGQGLLQLIEGIKHSAIVK